MDEVLPFEEYSSWIDPAYHGLMKDMSRDQRLEAVGLLTRHGELTAVGSWLLLPPSQPLWTHDKDRELLGPPLAFLKTIVPRSISYKTQTRFAEQLAWLLAGPRFYRTSGGTMVRPHININKDAFAAATLDIHICPKYIQWLHKEGHNSPIVKALQRGGLIRHTRMAEFWRPAPPVMPHGTGSRVLLTLPEV